MNATLLDTKHRIQEHNFQYMSKCCCSFVCCQSVAVLLFAKRFLGLTSLAFNIQF